MHKPSVVFFGSFLEYSAQVLEMLAASNQIDLVSVVTTPPKPAGRKQILTKTHVHQLAEKHDIPVFFPDKLNASTLVDFDTWLQTLDCENLDLFCVAGYGKLLPKAWLDYPQIAPVNIHFSLLPSYRGAMPGEWAMFMGETTTGVSLIEMSEKFDEGAIFARNPIEIEPNDTRETLYKKLYHLGGATFLDTLEKYLEFKLHGVLENLEDKENKDDEEKSDNLQIILPPILQSDSPTPYARMITKDDSYIPWELIELAREGKSPEVDQLTDFLSELPSKYLTQSGWAEAIEQLVRALYGWPGIWTKVETNKGAKRLKLHSAKIKNGKLILNQAQLEGETTTNFTNIQEKLV